MKRRPTTTAVAPEGQWQLPPREHTRRVEYRRCVYPACRVCTEGKGHGPCLYAVWREGKKVKRMYLGKA